MSSGTQSVATQSKSPASDELRQRRPLSRWGLPILIFVGGFIAGSAITFTVIHYQMFQMMRHPERLPGHIVDDLQRELDLSPEQRESVDMIVRNHVESIEKLREKIDPEFRRTFEEFESDIANVLTDQQRERWRAHLEEKRSRIFPRPPGGGMPPFPPPGMFRGKPPNDTEGSPREPHETPSDSSTPANK